MMVNIRTVFSQKNLTILSENHIKFFTASGIDKMRHDAFEFNKTAIIKKINRRVLEGEYEFTKYKELLILKDKYSLPRCVVVPTLQDRLCLKALHEYLVGKYANDARLPLPHETIRKLQNSLNKDSFDYFIKLDISNFYGNINHYKLFSDLKEKIKNDKILQLLKDALETPSSSENTKTIKGVHQGLPISNILAQIYMRELDNKMNSNRNIFYCRYVDDIIILCYHTNKDNVLKDIIYEIERNHMLSTNEAKFDSGSLERENGKSIFGFLGYAFAKNSKYNAHSDRESKFLVSVSTKNIQNQEQKLLDKFVRYKHTPLKQKNIESLIYEINLIITGAISKKVNEDVAKSKRYGWIFYYSQISDYSVLYELDAFLRKKIIELFEKEEQEKLLRNIKSFAKAFFEIKYRIGSTTYIFRPDDFNYEQKIEFLNEVYKLGIARNIKEDKLNRIFRRYTYKKINQQEKDLIKGRS